MTDCSGIPPKHASVRIEPGTIIPSKRVPRLLTDTDASKTSPWNSSPVRGKNPAEPPSKIHRAIKPIGPKPENVSTTCERATSMRLPLQTASVPERSTTSCLKKTHDFPVWGNNTLDMARRRDGRTRKRMVTSCSLGHHTHVVQHLGSHHRLQPSIPERLGHL